MKKAFEHIVVFFATGAYVGLIPWAPGTWGTLVGVGLYAGLVSQFSEIQVMGITVAFIFFSIFIASAYESFRHEHDPKKVVIDEIAGFLVAMMFLPPTLISYVQAFVLFRFFDILKPPPIRQLDEKVPGGFGTVIDDIAAGLITNVILQILTRHFPMGAT